MTLGELTAKVETLNRRIGPQSDAVRDYIGDCYNILKCGPVDPAHQTARVSDHFADYWTAVVDGTSRHYNPETGARLRS